MDIDMDVDIDIDRAGPIIYIHVWTHHIYIHMCGPIIYTYMYSLIIYIYMTKTSNNESSIASDIKLCCSVLITEPVTQKTDPHSDAE